MAKDTSFAGNRAVALDVTQVQWTRSDYAHLAPQHIQ